MNGMVIEDKAYSLEEVFSMIGEEYLLRKVDTQQKSADIVVDGFVVHPISLRYMLFYQKGTRCACCGKVGTHFKLCGDPKTNRRHFNLFADDGSLLTKDHIVPKSKGGADHVDNLQPMCAECNARKGNHHDTIKIDYVIATKENGENGGCFKSINKAAFHVVQNYLRPSKKDQGQVIRCAINAVLAIQNAIRSGEPYCGFIWSIERK